jgi:hypothetical protein
MNSKITEFFTYSIDNQSVNWIELVDRQPCSYLGYKCDKTRKSDAAVSIGTCTMKYGQQVADVIICPHRLLEKRRIFLDCLHLLTQHEPGNDLHIVPQVAIPGGNVDYFLVSVRQSVVRDFVGIELQTMDTTGTVWPERQRFLQQTGLLDPDAVIAGKSFGMNWKMTAKTTLVQLHHKIDTFQHINKRLVLVLQDHLLAYLRREFSFGHFSSPALVGDSMHIHAYQLNRAGAEAYTLQLYERISTDSTGIARCLGLKAQARVELEIIIKNLATKISNKTLFSL